MATTGFLLRCQEVWETKASEDLPCWHEEQSPTLSEFSGVENSLPLPHLPIHYVGLCLLRNLSFCTVRQYWMFPARNWLRNPCATPGCEAELNFHLKSFALGHLNTWKSWTQTHCYFAALHLGLSQQQNPWPRIVPCKVQSWAVLWNFSVLPFGAGQWQNSIGKCFWGHWAELSTMGTPFL